MSYLVGGGQKDRRVIWAEAGRQCAAPAVVACARVRRAQLTPSGEDNRRPAECEIFAKYYSPVCNNRQLLLMMLRLPLMLDELLKAEQAQQRQQ